MMLKEKHENRRVRMTRSLIKNALLELLEEKELTNITVSAVCETADVHRSTFYKYYTDIAEVLKEIEQELLNQIPMPHPELPQEQLFKETTAFFEYVKQNEKAFRILFGESTSNNFADRMVKILYNGYIPVPVDDELSASFIQLYIANGTVGMLREWIHRKFPVSSQKIAEMMYFLSKKLIT